MKRSVVFVRFVAVAILSLNAGESFSTSSLSKVNAPQQRDSPTTNRRRVFDVLISVGGLLGVAGSLDNAFAVEPTVLEVEMKTFIDPQGLFALDVPKRFFAIRRSAKGDLPNEKGQGRRGSSIFTAGDMAKAEVIAVERFPAGALLEENGVQATGDLDTIKDIGDPKVVANLIALRRDREKGGSSKAKVVKDSIVVSPDGQELSFVLRNQVEVQRPELLLEQTGFSELVRITTAKASLKSKDGNMLAIFASALETDWKTQDGIALESAVASFTALRPPTSNNPTR